LAGLLLEVMPTGHPTRDGSALPAHTHEELAKQIWTTRESVSRTVSSWRASGTIRMRGRRIVVVDPNRLRRVEDPAGGELSHPGVRARDA
jgi:CRP-like cAMP-binding protein